MEKDEYRKHFELEEHHWWFAGKRAMIQSLLKSYSRFQDHGNLLDVGCGTGFNLKHFEKQFSPYGCDLSREALNFAQKRGLQKNVQAHAENLPFKNSTFDIVCLLDLLYHRNVHNDISVLKEARRVLKDEGYVLITDSAFQFLLSQHDVALHTRERYSKKKLRERLREADFSMKKISYFNFFLFPVIALVKLIKKIHMKKKGSPKSNLKAVNPVMNALLYSIMKIEAFLIRRVNFSFGSSVICLAKKETDIALPRQ